MTAKLVMSSLKNGKTQLLASLKVQKQHVVEMSVFLFHNIYNILFHTSAYNGTFKHKIIVSTIIVSETLPLALPPEKLVM